MHFVDGDTESDAFLVYAAEKQLKGPVAQPPARTHAYQNHAAAPADQCLGLFCDGGLHDAIQGCTEDDCE